MNSRHQPVRTTPEMNAEPPAVQQPPHPLHALTSYELRNYRRDLEHAIAFFDRQQPVPAARDDLQARLDAVTGEQDSRSRPARA